MGRKGHLISEVKKMVSWKRRVKFPRTQFMADPGKRSLFNSKVVSQPREPSLFESQPSVWQRMSRWYHGLMSFSATLLLLSELWRRELIWGCSSEQVCIPDCEASTLFMQTQGPFRYCLLLGPLDSGSTSSLPRTKVSDTVFCLSLEFGSPPRPCPGPRKKPSILALLCRLMSNWGMSCCQKLKHRDLVFPGTGVTLNVNNFVSLILREKKKTTPVSWLGKGEHYAKRKEKFCPPQEQSQGAGAENNLEWEPALGRCIYIDQRHLLMNGPVLSSWVQVRQAGVVISCIHFFSICSLSPSGRWERKFSIWILG